MKPASLCLVVLLIGINVHSQTVLLPFGSAWKYLDDGTDQNTGWRSVGFADIQWKSGLAPLGFGDGDEATIVNKTGITTYFRKVVNIQNPAQYANYTVQIKRDDGAVVYINGNKILKSNMPSGNITYKSAASKITPDDGNEIKIFSLTSNTLISGNNTIAVEVHQAFDTNPDLSFDFQLIADVVPVAIAGANQIITLSPPATGFTILDGNASYDPDGTIKKYLWTKVSGPAGSTLLNAKTVAANISGLVAGTYVYRLAVTDNNDITASDDVSITVLQAKPTLFVDWKNTSLPVDGLPDGKQFGNNKLRSSTAYDAFNRTLANGKLRIMVDSQVPVDPNVSSAKYHYRAEFTEWPWHINLAEGTEQWVGWSYYFSNDYVRGVTPISIFQNHAGGTNPYPAFQLELAKPNQLPGALGGEVQVINNCSSPKVRKLTSIRPNPGDRIDIICHVVHARDGNGLLEFWINGIKIHSQVGSTIYPAPENWGGNNKWGIYHHQWTDPSNVQLDIAAGHTRFELLMGNLRQITRSPGDPEYLSDSKAAIDPAQDIDEISLSARSAQPEISNTTSVEEKKLFDVYPSPVKRGNDFTIRGNTKQNFEVTIINQAGQLLYNYNVHESVNINTTNMPSGLYFLWCKVESQNQRSKIIVTE